MDFRVDNLFVRRFVISPLREELSVFGLVAKVIKVLIGCPAMRRGHRIIPTASTGTLILCILGMALYIAACINALAIYVLSIIHAYKIKGLVMAAIATIPILGQVVWFIAEWAIIGFWNSYTHTVLLFVAIFVAASFVNFTISLIDNKQSQRKEAVKA